MYPVMKQVYSEVFVGYTWSKKGITLEYRKGERLFHFCFGDWTNKDDLPLRNVYRKAILTCTAT